MRGRGAGARAGSTRVRRSRLAPAGRRPVSDACVIASGAVSALGLGPLAYRVPSGWRGLRLSRSRATRSWARRPAAALRRARARGPRRRSGRRSRHGPAQGGALADPRGAGGRAPGLSWRAHRHRPRHLQRRHAHRGAVLRRPRPGGRRRLARRAGLGRDLLRAVQRCARRVRARADPAAHAPARGVRGEHPGDRPRSRAGSIATPAISCSPAATTPSASSSPPAPRRSARPRRPGRADSDRP